MPTTRPGTGAPSPGNRRCSACTSAACSPPGVGVCSASAQLDIRMTKRAGLWTGASTGTPPKAGQGACESASIVTVRYPIGQKARVSFDDGIARYGWNTPIQSVHTNGANVLRCDGSVAFLSTTLPFDTLRWLCIRDDGQTASES